MKRIIFLLTLIILPCVIKAQSLLENEQCGSKYDKVRAEKVHKVTPFSASAQYTIPVVFHVLYANEAQNVSDAQIQKLLATTNLDLSALNTDLVNLPADFSNVQGNASIVLINAIRDPSGETLNNIIRKQTTLHQFSPKGREAFQLSPLIDNRKYLNVYICNVKDGTSAYTPGPNVAKNDGIVIDYEYVREGSRTLTHEIGHWLNLYHVFVNDAVSDTPAQKKKHSKCETHPKIEQGHAVMFMNFMDYSTCRIFFTAGQTQRMKEFIYEYKEF